MFPRHLARLLHQAPPEIRKLFVKHNSVHCNNNNNVHINFCRRCFERRAWSSTSKKITREESDHERHAIKNAPSLIAQRMLQSQQTTKSQRNTSISNKEMSDAKLRIEDLKRKDVFVDEDFTHLPSALTENENMNERESPGTLGQSKDEDFIENIVLKEDVHAKPKPSPLLGTEDRSVPVSDVPCAGCGALLHCQHRTMPGFLPSERFKLLSKPELRSSICQRCHYIQHCDAFVEVTTSAEDYAQMISKIKPTRSVVVMVVDVMDIAGSIVPNLANYIGHKHPLLIVGNKVDLIAPDSSQYLVSLRDEVLKSCLAAGLSNIRKVMLISAKTGFGIERLIDTLFSMYKMKGDVFIVGTANAGKSTLFNTLLASDYCRHRARDLIQRATVSVWPGTTLNLLKFPIMNPTPRTLARRHQRLKQERALLKEAETQKRNKQKDKQEAWGLKETISTTDTRSHKQIERDNSSVPWGQEVFAYKATHGVITPPPTSDRSPWSPDSFDPSTYAHSYWVHDTPGVINDNQTFNLLDPDECPTLQPVDTMTPRCVVLKPGTAMFVSGLARLDYVHGSEPMMSVVHCSPSIPVRVVSLEEADEFYLQHAGTPELGIPVGDRDRLNRLPSLVGMDVSLEGQEDKMAVADIQLSSIGWVSLAPRPGCKVKVTAYTPSRKGVHVRQPSLLPRFLQFKGRRIKGTPFFWPRRVGLSVTGKPLLLLSDGDKDDDGSDGVGWSRPTNRRLPKK